MEAEDLVEGVEWEEQVEEPKKVKKERLTGEEEERDL